MKVAILTMLAAVPLFSQQYEYQIDTPHSSAQFAVKHMMVSTVRGDFKKLTGSVVFDPSNLAACKVNAVIDASTVNTRDDQRDGHLKSPDFFDVAKYPTITFQSTKVEKKDGKYMITGDLTMHGVTKQAVLSVDGPSAEIKDPRGAYRVGASATTTVNRKDFNLIWNKALDGGGVMVGDEVNITLDIEAVRKTGQPAGANATK